MNVTQFAHLLVDFLDSFTTISSSGGVENGGRHKMLMLKVETFAGKYQTFQQGLCRGIRKAVTRHEKCNVMVQNEDD